MKLLNCLKCNDIFAIKSTVKQCDCGLSKGMYQKDQLNVVIVGECRVLGMLNQEYVTSLTAPIVPFKLIYKWFPILPEAEHHVLKTHDEVEFNKVCNM